MLLSSGMCHGGVRREEDRLRIAALHVILDFTNSQDFDAADRRDLV